MRSASVFPSFKPQLTENNKTFQKEFNLTRCLTVWGSSNEWFRLRNSSNIIIALILYGVLNIFLLVWGSFCQVAYLQGFWKRILVQFSVCSFLLFLCFFEMASDLSAILFPLRRKLCPIYNCKIWNYQCTDTAQHENPTST